MFRIQDETLLGQQGCHHSLHIQLLQVVVALARADKQNRLACRVRHRDGRANLKEESAMNITQSNTYCHSYLVVNGVKLGEHNAINGSAREIE